MVVSSINTKTEIMALPHFFVSMDVGGGHNPARNAHIVCDRYFTDNYHRGKNLKILGNAWYVQADGNQLPFKPKSIDFIISNHVIEHTPDPAHYARELSRVGKAGSLVMPTEFYEACINAQPYHLWVFAIKDGKIYYTRKTEAINFLTDRFGCLFREMVARDDWFKMFVCETSLFNIRELWNDSIECYETDRFPIVDYNDRDQALAVLNYTPREFRVNISNEQITFNELIKLMQCPECKSELQVEGTKLKCTGCSVSYTVNGKIISRDGWENQ